MRLGRQAARQHGVVSHEQLLASGVSRTGVGRWVEAGRLHRIHRGVYAVGHRRLTLEGRFMAAVLAAGAGAVLSHHSAAVLWRILELPSVPLHVTAPRRGGRGRRAFTLHRASLEADAVTVKDGIAVTTPARTLIDLADLVPPRALGRALDEAEYLRLDLTGLQPKPGRRGASRLANTLTKHTPGSTRTRSELEEKMLALCDEAALPRPAVNTELLGHEADFAWPAERLIVETDGWQAHGTRRAFEDDRRRDARLTAAGYRVVRITWRRLEREPEAVAAQLRLLLEAEGA
jgi:very-short-patch-repair endonuclease